MKSLAVFAHFDKDNLVDDYVIYYLKELKKVADTIIFVSDNDLPESEIKKLDGIADFTLAKKHGEYDFGSYKRGFKIAEENNLLKDTDNLIFANDSCYGPFCPLSSIFDKMNEENCDFWGITSNKNYLEGKTFPCKESEDKHIQSYFVVFKKNVFESDVFKNFIDSIKKAGDKFEIIENYEIGLTSLLCKNNFSFAVLSDKEIGKHNLDDIIDVDAKTPFVFMKTSLCKINYFIPMLSWWKQKVNKTSEYPVEMAFSNLKRVRDISNFNLKFCRRHILRLHLLDRKIFILGKWYKI